VEVIRCTTPIICLRSTQCQTWFSNRWIQSFWEHEQLPQYLASHAGNIQLASLAIHEATVYYVISDHPRPNFTWNEYRCLSTTPKSELEELWANVVTTFDISTKKKFVMRAVLMWIINYFLAYADLPGWSTKGQKACLCCMHFTRPVWLTYDKK
jgi:hypothetical protein